MPQLSDYIQTDDWKNEKHVPVIDFPGSPSKGESFAVVVTVGKEIKHPNTTEHHIAWISLYFKPEGDKFVHELGGAYFSAHGASVEGANSMTLHCEPQAVFQVALDQPGTLIATSYCNIHGLWESQEQVKF
jgi:superoxide reductase